MQCIADRVFSTIGIVGSHGVTSVCTCPRRVLTDTAAPVLSAHVHDVATCVHASDVSSLHVCKLLRGIYPRDQTTRNYSSWCMIQERAMVEWAKKTLISASWRTLGNLGRAWKLPEGSKRTRGGANFLDFAYNYGDGWSCFNFTSNEFRGLEGVTDRYLNEVSVLCWYEG